jgi:hypothetical protein
MQNKKEMTSDTKIVDIIEDKSYVEGVIYTFMLGTSMSCQFITSSKS